VHKIISNRHHGADCRQAGAPSLGTPRVLGRLEAARSSPILAGRSKSWVKVKNPDYPAYRRGAGPVLAGLRKVRPHFCAAFAASGADEIRFDVRQPDMIGPLVGADLDVMTASMIAAIDQDGSNAAFAQFSERDLLRVGRHALIVARPLRPPPALDTGPRGFAGPTPWTEADNGLLAFSKSI
jgi:hypothetical protein